MAKKVSIQMTDDLNPDLPADETVEFTIDGINYEIDLSTQNAEKMRDSLNQWINAARKISGRPRGRRPLTPRPGNGHKAEMAAIRAWARANGVKISTRGRIPADVVTQYHNAKTAKTEPIFSEAE